MSHSLKTQYFVYITTNPAKTVLYIGMTNSLERRIGEHTANRGKSKTFAGRYYCRKLIYWERYWSWSDAFERERQLKKWSRKKKESLINSVNPNWKFYRLDFLWTNKGVY